jgi:protein LSM14
MAKDSSEVVIPLRKEGCYNKKSSFFDNISSDLRDRMELQEKSEKSGGQSPIDGRAMRREERTKNMETFGQGSVDGGFRGGYRGGRGRARGGYGRSGGFRGGRGGLSGFEGRGRGRGRGGAGGGVSEKSTVPAV